MAFAVHFRFQWESRNGNDYRIDILENNYSGNIIKRPLGGAPQLRRDKNGAVCGTSLEFLAQAQEDGEFAVLYTSNPQAFRVDLYQNSTLTWQGFVTPELYSEPYIAPPYNVRVTATDNLGELKLSDYTAQGRVTISSLLTYILNKTGLTFSVHWLSAMHPSAATNVTAANMPTSTQINVDHMEGETLYDVLTKVLSTFNAFIVQHGCSWLIVRETDLEALRSSATITAPDGSTYAIADFGSMVNRTWWPVGFLSQSVVPAKKKKVITAPNNWIENLLPKTATSSTNATYYDSEDGDTPYYELVPWNGSQQYSQASVAFWSPSSEFVPVKDLNLSLVLQTFGVLAGHTYGKKCAAVTVKVVGSDGNNYINCWLGEDGNLTTTTVEALPIYAVGQDAPEQHNLVIPIASQMSTIGFTKIYQIQVEIKSTDAEDGISRMRLYGWNCNIPEQNKGYQVTCILNNGARGEDGETEIVAADNTNKDLETVFVTNALKYTAALGGAPIAKWASENISSLSLLEFLARDYSLGIAVPRLRMEGIINVPLNASLPLLFRGGASDINNSLIFWPEKWDWNLVDDALDIAMVSLPAASVQVTSVTRTAQGSDGMVISSGGSAPSSGGGGTGTVTSVALAMPTGFTISGSPITTAGIISIAFAEGYSLPLTEDVAKGVTAYGWGDHSQVGYLTGITSAMVETALGFTPTANTGTVTSIKVTTPTGLRVSNGTSQTITGSGTFALQLQSGYSIPTTDKQSSWDAGVTSANAAFAAAVTNRVDNASGIVDGSYNLVTANAIYDKFANTAAMMPIVTRTSNYAKIADNNDGDGYLITAGAVAKYVQANRSLNDLTDVQVNGPQNNDFFVYSTANSLNKWTNISNSNVLQSLIGSAIGGQEGGSGMYRPIYWGGSSFLAIPAGSVASGNNYPVSGNEVYTHFLNTAAGKGVDATAVSTSQNNVPTSYAVTQYVSKITDKDGFTGTNMGCVTGAAMYDWLQSSSIGMPAAQYANTTALPSAADNDGYFNVPSSTGQNNPGDNYLPTCSMIYKYIHKHWWNVKDKTIGTAGECSLETAPSGAASSYGSDNVIMTQKAVNYKLRNYVTGTVSTSASEIKNGSRVIVMADDLYGALQEWGLIN